MWRGEGGAFFLEKAKGATLGERPEKQDSPRLGTGGGGACGIARQWDYLGVLGDTEQRGRKAAFRQASRSGVYTSLLQPQV